MGFGLVGASTWVLGLLDLAALSLYKDLTDLHRLWYEALQPAPPLGQMKGSSDILLQGLPLLLVALGSCILIFNA